MTKGSPVGVTLQRATPQVFHKTSEVSDFPTDKNNSTVNETGAETMTLFCGVLKTDVMSCCYRVQREGGWCGQLSKENIRL